MKSSVNKLSWY